MAQTAVESSPGWELVEKVNDVSFDDLSDDVKKQSKLLVFDTIGAMLEASNSNYDTGQKISSFANDMGAPLDSTIIGYDAKTSPPNAALANGTLGYFCDIDAYNPNVVMHAPAVAIPAALAVSEQNESTGQEFLFSSLLGVETAVRVSRALNPQTLYSRGFHPTPVCGSIGASISAGYLEGLDQDEYITALGLAGLQTSGLLAWKEESTESFRPFNPGMAARNGVTSGLLASRGFGSPMDPFGGEYNLFRAFSDENKNVSALTDGFGEEFELMEHAIKNYSCCGFLHPGLDALLSLKEQNDIDPEEISAIRLHAPATGAELIDGTELKSHSAQYTLALAALTGDFVVDYLVDDKMSDPKVSNLMDSVTVIRSDELDKTFPDRFTSVVEIEMDDGSEYSKRVDHGKGTIENPFTYEEVKDKFRKHTSDVISGSEQDQILDLVENIEDVETIGELTQYL